MTKQTWQWPVICHISCQSCGWKMAPCCSPVRLQPSPGSHESRDNSTLLTCPCSLGSAGCGSATLLPQLLAGPLPHLTPTATLAFFQVPTCGSPVLPRDLGPNSPSCRVECSTWSFRRAAQKSLPPSCPQSQWHVYRFFNLLFFLYLTWSLLSSSA